MKSVILIGLLSLSVCFSVAAPPEVPARPALVAATAPAPSNATDEKLPAKTDQVTVAPIETAKANHTEAAASPTNTTSTNATVTPQTNNETKNDTKPTEKDNKTDDKSNKDVPKPDEKTTTVAPKIKNETAPAVPDNKTNGTKPDNKDGKTDATTQKSEVVVPTEAPKVIQSSRAFDGPSFIGGIILTLGLLAIGFMGFKYYKNQTERNYHTL